PGRPGVTDDRVPFGQEHPPKVWYLRRRAVTAVRRAEDRRISVVRGGPHGPVSGTRGRAAGGWRTGEASGNGGACRVTGPRYGARPGSAVTDRRRHACRKGPRC